MRKSELENRVRQLERYITGYLGAALPDTFISAHLDALTEEGLEDCVKRRIDRLVGERVEGLVKDHLAELTARCVRAENMEARLDGMGDAIRRMNTEIRQVMANAAKK